MKGLWPESLLGNKCTQQQGLRQLDAYISVGISSNPINAFCRKLSFSRPAKPKGLQKAGGIYLDTEKWVPAECFPGPIRAAALCSSTCHSVRSALSSCQNKSCGTKLSAPSESALLSIAKSCHALQTPTEPAHGHHINDSQFSFLLAFPFCKKKKKKRSSTQNTSTFIPRVHERFRIINYDQSTNCLRKESWGLDSGIPESQS